MAENPHEEFLDLIIQIKALQRRLAEIAERANDQQALAEAGTQLANEIDGQPETRDLSGFGRNRYESYLEKEALVLRMLLTEMGGPALYAPRRHVEQRILHERIDRVRDTAELIRNAADGLDNLDGHPHLPDVFQDWGAESGFGGDLGLQ